MNQLAPPSPDRDQLHESPTPADPGVAMHAFARDLFPLSRSITGDGLRQTLRMIGARIPLQTMEIPTGTRVLDWEIPAEWNLRRAWLKDPTGRIVADTQVSTLHVVNYSEPVHARLDLADLRPHLHSLPEHPDWIPYRTSYYKRTWGFCLRHRELESLGAGEYEVFIDSTLARGALSIGECVLQGSEREEVLISCHTCHPSLANDNLSGIAVATWLAAWLAGRERRLTYRFVFAPGTIGSIAWLATHPDEVRQVRHGLLLTCCGDPGAFTWKKSRRGSAVVDRAAAHVLRTLGHPHRLIDFFPYGYDERQYCSPGYNLPLGCLMRTPHGEYPEYHTSADDLGLISAPALGESLDVAAEIVRILETNRRVRSLNPLGEPQLGRRGLYRPGGGERTLADLQMAYLWVMNLADGEHDLLAMAERSQLPYRLIARAAEDLTRVQLLEDITT